MPELNQTESVVPGRVKKVLIVTAHPSSLGLTHKIADAYKSGAESVGAQVEIINLYTTEIKQDFLRFENIRETPTDESKRIMQQKISDADDLVFVHPLWWLGMPAILKNFLDVNFSARFAFRYEKRKYWSPASLLLGGGKRVGMLKGKTASVFITCDGSLLLYLLMGLPFWSTWRFAILYYCGLKTRSIKILSKKTFRPESDWQKFLDTVRGIGQRV